MKRGSFVLHEFQNGFIQSAAGADRRQNYFGNTPGTQRGRQHDHAVLKTGQPIYDRVEHLTTAHGDCVTNICSTIPIIQKGKIVGAIDFARSIDDDRNQNAQRRYINLPKLKSEEESLYHLEDIVSSSKKINEIKKQIPMIANTDSAVMIYGETGTGKEMIAQSIHTSGVRCAHRFVSQN